VGKSGVTEAEILKRTSQYAETTLRAETNAHDWWHVYRVEKLASRIAKTEEGANVFVVRLGALLHDIADWKFHDGDTEIGPRTAREWLDGLDADPEIIEQVVYIVRHISYRGGTNKHVMQSIEGKIVQDADRLDALGAIGIARTFTFGGSRNREMYDPKIKPISVDSFKDYQKSLEHNTTINHFYEKLLKLKDGMHTETARKLAQHRHDLMVQFLDEFHAEWEGKA
jgi:uncharacterized protein